MADYLGVTFEREGERLVLSVVAPNTMVSQYCVWRDYYRPGDHDHQLIKMISSEKRVVRWFNRRCSKMLRAGWTEI